jgi:predicted GIY-YIG superfamily endonuclease
MYYVYRLESISDPSRHYIGYTTNLKTRLRDHNRGRCETTASFAPWRIEFYAAFEVDALALSFEKYLKTGSGKAFGNKRLWTTT